MADETVTNKPTILDLRHAREWGMEGLRSREDPARRRTGAQPPSTVTQAVRRPGSLTADPTA
jgi:hypothetical protein